MTRLISKTHIDADCVSNCNVLGTSAAEATHVKRMTPMDTKKAEYANDPKYCTKQESGRDPKRETNTRNLRAKGDVRPLGGNK